MSHLAKILQKTGAKPSAVYSLFTDETGCKRITALCFGIKDGEDYMLLYPCARWWKVAELKLLKMRPVYPECDGYSDVCNDEPACITKDSTAEDVEAWRAFNQRRADLFGCPPSNTGLVPPWPEIPCPSVQQARDNKGKTGG